MSEQPQRSNALQKLRVVDLTTFLSGPFCTQILADLGAEVVKVESLEGDSSRVIPPHFVGDDSAYFLSTNRNKRSISVDLKTAAGCEIARALIADADVVVENFRPGVCARLGLDPDELQALNPALVWASITGFGRDGPWANRGAYDMIVQAASGVMSLNGEPEGSPVRLGVPAGDLVAGLYTVIGILAAVQDRDRTGMGQRVDVAMYDAQLATLSYQAAYALIGGVTPSAQGSRHDSIPTYRTFRAKDDRIVAVTANTDGMWRSACDVLGVPELVDDPLFANGAMRLVNKEALWQHWEAAFATETADYWVSRLNERGVPSSTIKTVPEALADSQAVGRQMVLEFECGSQVARVAGNPVRLSGAGSGAHSYPPSLGADTDELLRERLQMTAEQIDRLRADKVVG